MRMQSPFPAGVVVRSHSAMRSVAPLACTLAVVTSVGCANTTNPPVTREPRWDSPRTRVLAERACFDCHSNQTKWPWYASAPLVGLWMGDHVDEGREKLNFSTWSTPGKDAHEAADVVEEGEMPLSSYTWLHGEATLSAEEKSALVAGLKATFAADPPPTKHDGDGEHGKKKDDDDD